MFKFTHFVRNIYEKEAEVGVKRVNTEELFKEALYRERNAVIMKNDSEMEREKKLKEK